MKDKDYIEMEKILVKEELQKQTDEIKGIADNGPTNEELDLQKMKNIEYHNYEKKQQPILINRAERRRRERRSKNNAH